MKIMRYGFLIAAVLLSTQGAFAQNYPSKPLTLVVPFAAGGGVDSTARLVAQQLGKALGQTVTVQNRPGAGMLIGADFVAKAQPDGYTLVVVSSTHVANPSLFKKMPFHPVEDFTPVTIFGNLTLAIISGPRHSFNTLGDVVKYGKANPGKLTVGNSDATTILAGETFKSMAGVDIAQVPYKGGALVATDVMGGHISLGVISAAAALPLHKAQSVKILGMTSTRRLASLPDVPTVAEAVNLPDYNVQAWLALLGPPKMPEPVVRRLQREMATIMADRATQARLIEQGVEPVLEMSPERTVTVMKNEMVNFEKVLKAVGMHPE